MLYLLPLLITYFITSLWQVGEQISRHPIYSMIKLKSILENRGVFMTIPFLNLSRQYQTIQPELEAKALEVLRSGAYVGGKYVTEFEAAMADYLGVKHVISCANGTDAIVIALRAAGIGHGDEVITTPFTFFATPEAIASVGAVPVFVDIAEHDFNMDPTKIEAAITPKTKAIMPVHIFGVPADMDAINAIAKKHNLVVIEDGAQSIGSTYRGTKVGNTDNMVTSSFYPTKNLGAFGDAGMITTNSDDYAIICRGFKEHGMAKTGAMARELLTGVKDEFEETVAADPLYNPYKYYNFLIGYNSRMDAIQAALLTIKLAHIESYNQRRTAIADKYTAALSGTVITPVAPVDATTCYHQYVVRTEKKEELIKHLESKGIGTAAFYPVPMHLQKALSYLNYQVGDFPIAETICNQTVCLPAFPELTDEEVDTVIAAIKDFFN